MASFNYQQRLLDVLERRFQNLIVAEKNRFVEQQSKKLFMTRRISEIDMEAHEKNMRDLFTEQYAKVIARFSQLVLRTTEMKAFYSLEQKRDFWDTYLRQWIAERGGEAAKQTSLTTRDDIQRALQEAVDNPDEYQNEQEFTKKILTAKSYSAFRARVIARTETHGAAMWASKNTAKKIARDSGIEIIKQWNAVEDERTRFSHNAVDGIQKLMEQDFIVGGLPMDRPGDPRGGAGNVINCRCVLTYRRRAR